MFIRWTGYFDFNSGCNALISKLPCFGLINQKLGSKGANRNEEPAVGWAFAQADFIPSVRDCVKLKNIAKTTICWNTITEYVTQAKVIYETNRTTGNVGRNMGMVIFTQWLRRV